jgi:uracil-DNA glycosylase family 4
VTDCRLWLPDFTVPGRKPADPLTCKTCGALFLDHANPFDKPDFPCSACTLYREPGPVGGVGPTPCSMMGVGEAPGGQEINEPYLRREAFAPFIGGAGKILSALMAHAGVPRKAMYLTNAVKCRPPGNRLPTAHEINCCSTFLDAEIEAANPNVTLAFGETPLAALTGKKGIGLWRGVATLGKNGRKVFPNWHPAFIARAQYNWPFAVHDLVRAQAESASPEIHRIPFHIVRDANTTRDRDVVLRDARERGALTFDFETSGLSAKRDSIVYLGVASRSDTAHVFHWSPGTRQLFQEVLDDPRIEIVGQNILYFDLPFAEEKGISIDKAWAKVFDTMVAFHLCNASYGQVTVREQSGGTFRARGMEKDLSMIASCHTDIEYWKSRDSYKNDLLGVCGVDCIATDRSALDVELGLKAELAALDMTDLYYKHVLPVHPILHRMTKRGVKIDQAKAMAWKVGLEETANEKEAALKLALGDPYLNLDSPKQLMDLLYNKMKLPIQTTKDRKKGARPTANAEAIEALAAQFPEHAILKDLVSIRTFRKLVRTNIDIGLESEDGRLHPRFGVSKASTGRFNSWDPNAQNQPEDIRDIWVPDDDEHILLSADSSQIEWRIGMILSGDPVGLELLASGVDNHSAIAAETLSKKIGPNKDGTCDHPDCREHVTGKERYASKFIVYGLGYGRGAESISVGHNLPLPFVEAFIRRFFTRFRVYAAWRDRNVKFVQANHYLANAFKRRRWWYSYQVTEVYNFPMQSNAADMMYDELIWVDAELPKDAHLVLTVHDENVVHAAKDVAKQAYQALKDNMQRCWPQLVDASSDRAMVERFYPNGWFCPVDIGIGTNWKMCKSKEPEDKAARAALMKELGIAA